MEQVISIECDKNMVVHLLRNWRPHRLQAKGFRLEHQRPRLIALRNGVCPCCPEPLVDDGKVTHVDHHQTVQQFAERVLKRELTFDEAYRQLWDDSNLRAVHRKCNYARNRKGLGVAKA